MLLSYLISALPPLKKHQYHVQEDNNDKKDKILQQDHADNLASKVNAHKLNMERIKIETPKEEITMPEVSSYYESYKAFQGKKEEDTTKDFINEDKTYHKPKQETQFIYQPLTPPSPKTSSTSSASKLLQQLQIHRNNVSEKRNNSVELFHNGTNPLSQLAEISLAAAAANATLTRSSQCLNRDINDPLTRQKIIANLMFPSILQHMQQQGAAEMEDEHPSSIQSVPTPSNSPSPPPAHLSPYKYPSQNSSQAPRHSTLMEILSKPPLKPQPPMAHNQVSVSSVPLSTSEKVRCSGLSEEKERSSFCFNNNPYGSVKRLQLNQPSLVPQLPPPQSVPEDLTINKIARRLDFKESSQCNEIFRKMNSLSTDNIFTQPEELTFNTVLQTSLPLKSVDRNSVESRRSSDSISGQHECQDCGKIYSTSSNLARHRQTHR